MSDPPGLLSRYRGALLGLAVGDAVGATLEFTPRGSRPPLTDMVGGGVHRLDAGDWTDDTSMALCLAASLIERGGFDADDQMRRYARWLAEGYMTPRGRCIDVGGTVMRAMRRYADTRNPLAGSPAPDTAGNGALMRLVPVPLFFHPDVDAIRHWSQESTRTTHAAPECLEASRLFAGMLHRALAGAGKEEILAAGAGDTFTSDRIAGIARGEYRGKTEAQIQSSGYVVHTLEAALWCFARSDDFEAAVLMAANLADDADTTAAVCGQLAGAHWGLAGIPEPWRRRVAMADRIRLMADTLFELSAAGTAAAPPDDPT